jgi:hypothetical protein
VALLPQAHTVILELLHRPVADVSPTDVIIVAPAAVVLGIVGALLGYWRWKSHGREGPPDEP